MFSAEVDWHSRQEFLKFELPFDIMIHTKVLVYGVFRRSDGRGWVGELLVADVKELGGRELNGEAIEDGIPLPERRHIGRW
ncbi:hypothetical protein BGW80DRAFT_1334320 [Lactifluus volemus]|nr:hypothetical protein BGW80DRAFT_1334320 [Lactifluus volemus]